MEQEDMYPKMAETVREIAIAVEWSRKCTEEEEKSLREQLIRIIQERQNKGEYKSVCHDCFDRSQGSYLPKAGICFEYDDDELRAFATVRYDQSIEYEAWHEIPEYDEIERAVSNDFQDKFSVIGWELTSWGYF